MGSYGICVSFATKDFYLQFIVCVTCEHGTAQFIMYMYSKVRAKFFSQRAWCFGVI